MKALEKGDILTLRELERIIPHNMNLSDEDLLEMTNGGNKSRVNDRISWGRAYLKAAGLVGYPRRGCSQITDAGKKALSENPTAIDLSYLEKFDSFLKFTGRKIDGKEAANNRDLIRLEYQAQTPQESMDLAFLEINSALRNEILSELAGGNNNDITRETAAFFEKLVVKLLMKMGYGGLLDGEGVVTPASSDGGIDGIIREDKLGFSNIYIQAKCYALDRKVGRPEIQTFVGAIARKSGKGLFITTTRFTSEAKDYARENHVVLVDGDKLADLMIEYGVGVSTIQTYEIKKLDYGFFSE